MKKENLVAIVSGKLGATKKDAETYIDVVFESFIEGVDQDGIAEIARVIRVEKVPTKARKGRNPATGAEIDIPEGEKLKTTLLKKFKDIVGK